MTFQILGVLESLGSCFWPVKNDAFWGLKTDFLIFGGMEFASITPIRKITPENGKVRNWWFCFKLIKVKNRWVVINSVFWNRSSKNATCGKNDIFDEKVFMSYRCQRTFWSPGWSFFDESWILGVRREKSLKSCLWKTWMDVKTTSKSVQKSEKVVHCTQIWRVSEKRC